MENNKNNSYLNKKIPFWDCRLGSAILYLVYDIVFLLGFVLYFPIYVWRRKINFSALKEKLGFIKKANTKKAIWIQVVSVGEVILIENLINKLKEAYQLPIVISTTTLSGNVLARKKYSQVCKVIFFPLDISFIIKRVIRKIRPCIFIAVETELWPNIFRRLKRKNIPIVVINGRISDAAFKRYRKVKRFMSKVLDKCDLIGVQNPAYKERFEFLGADSARIRICGNMKFDSFSLDEKVLFEIKKVHLPVLKRNNRLLLVAASTHYPEEEILFDYYASIINQEPKVALLIAPRHPERTSKIEIAAREKGFNLIRTSKIPVTGHHYGPKDIFILDSIGRLKYFYSICDICFVGGSLSGDGGHNILEPVYFSKPTVFGSSMSNFVDVESAVLDLGAGIKVKDRNQLAEALTELIKDKNRRQSFAQACEAVFQQERWSLANNFELISQCLD